MIGIAIDAVILIALLKWRTDADVGLLGAILVSLGTAIGTAVLAYGLVGYMGEMAVLPAAAVASALLGGRARRHLRNRPEASDVRHGVWGSNLRVVPFQVQSPPI